MWSRRSRVRIPSLTPRKSLHSGPFVFPGGGTLPLTGTTRGQFPLRTGGEFGEPPAPRGMPRSKRANGAGAVYVKHGSYYGRWLTPAGRTNRKLGPVRRPGSASGMTRTQAEKRLRELMAEDAVPVVPDPDRTVEIVG